MNLLFKNNISNTVPSSKSVANRVILFSFLCFKEVYIYNCLKSEDILIMLKNLNNFKCFSYFFIKNALIIKNSPVLKLKKTKFYFSNAGTVARTLIFILFLINKKVVLDGNANMRTRPIIGLINLLETTFKNKKIKFLKKKNYFPIIIVKTNIVIKRYNMNIYESISSQFVSSYIIGLAYIIKNPFYILIKKIVSIDYVLLTVKLIKKFNIKIIFFKNNIIIYPGKYNNFNKKFYIEKDVISLSYLLLQLIKTKKKKTIAFSRNIYHAEKFILKFLNIVGLFFYFVNNNLNIIKYKKKVYCFCINCYKLIDSSIIFPFLIFYNITKIKIFNIYNWNFKECNRIIAVAKELKKLGAKIYYGKNWMIIKKYKNRKNILLLTYNDHRIAMSAYKFKNYVYKPNCVKKTFPDFFK